MAVQLLSEGGVANTPFKTYIVDLLMELPYLEAPLGAQATCLEDGRKYVMGSDGTWKKINNGVDLYDEQVTESKIAYKAVSADKIANEAVTQRTLNADTVQAEEEDGTTVSTVTTGEKYQWNHSGGGSLYQHNLTLVSAAQASVTIIATCILITNNATPMTFSALATYLHNNSLTSQNNMANLSGKLGGDNDYFTCGMYSADGQSIKVIGYNLGNVSTTATFSGLPYMTDTVVQIM